MSSLIATIGFGVVTAATIALAGVGLTIQVSVTHVFNFAYGAILIAGTYVGYVLNTDGQGFAVCCLAGAGAGAVLSLVLNRVIFAPFARKGISQFGMLIVGLQLSLVIVSVIQATAGEGFFSYQLNTAPPVSGLKSLDLLLTSTQLVVIGLTIVVVLVLHAFLQYTQLGQAMRATSSNSKLAKACGIRTARVIDITWLISGAMCGLAGVVLGYSVGAFVATSGTDFLVVMLAVLPLAAGSPLRAALASLAVGVAMEVAALYTQSDLKYLVAYGILVLILVVQPPGLFRGTAALFREDFAT